MRKILMLLACALLAACQPKTPATRSASNLVYVSIPPLQPFCQEILGDAAKCCSLMPFGTNPHQFEPTPRQAIEVSKSDLFITAGMEFEGQISKRLKAAGLPVLDLQNHEEGHDEAAEEEESRHHDPHIWLSPLRMEECCARMTAELIRLYPDRAGEIEARGAALLKKLHAFDKELREKFQDKKACFLAYHPAWSAFAQCYGLKEIAIEKDGHEPTPRHLNAVLDEVKKSGLKKIFVQKGNSERLAANIAKEAGLAVISHDALSTNYYAELRSLSLDILDMEAK